jgi:hypothetical protein
MVGCRIRNQRDPETSRRTLGVLDAAKVISLQIGIRKGGVQKRGF